MRKKTKTKTKTPNQKTCKNGIPRASQKYTGFIGTVILTYYQKIKS